MNRFYIDEEYLMPDGLYLSPEDVHHAKNVLRLKVGDPVEIIHRRCRYAAAIAEISAEGIRVTPGSPLPSTEPSLRITLFQGLPKGDKMDWIVQKAVELGADNIIPVQMSRSVVRLKPQDGRKKADRWRRIAREAGKQSGRCVLPDVSDPVAFASLSDHLSSLDAVVVPWESCSCGGPKFFVSGHKDIHSLGIIIGPEGGITDHEIAFLEKEKCIPVTLGPRILRTETAGLASIAAFLSLYGEME